MTAADDATRGAHEVEITHDAESHACDCHDDCRAAIICHGVTDDCRTWWACLDHDHPKPEEFEWDDIEAHGVLHRWIDGCWMTPSEQCIGHTLDDDADELVYELPNGRYPVDLDCDEGFVSVHLWPSSRPGMETDHVH